jgi:hypothetical protein
MPAGTTVSLSTTNGTILSRTSLTVGGCGESSTYSVTMESDATQGAGPNFICSNSKTHGYFTVTVTTPKGIITSRMFDVTD